MNGIPDEFIAERPLRCLSSHMSNTKSHYTRARIKWVRTDDAEYPYSAELAGDRLLVKINDFPAEPLFTLVVDGEELGYVHSWPRRWVRPEARGV